MCQKSNPTLFDELPNPESRNEEFLSFLTGKSTDLAGLPEPQSRIEMFLNYLCHNGGGGSGGSITIDQITGLRDELNKKSDSLVLTDSKIGLNNGSIELSNIPITTTAEIELILQNLQ